MTNAFSPENSSFHADSAIYERPANRSRRLPRTAALVLAAGTAFGALAAPAHAESDTAAEAVDNAQEEIGTPYAYGGSGPDSFDCSGLIQWSYDKAGVDLPRTTYDQFEAGEKVDRGDVEPGDLMFFYDGPSHAGIYIGDGKMVHAPNSDSSVETVDLSDYYDDQFTGAVRVA